MIVLSNYLIYVGQKMNYIRLNNMMSLYMLYNGHRWILDTLHLDHRIGELLYGTWLK